MFFRNLTLFRFSAAVAGDLSRLDDVLGEHRLRPCGPLELFTKGFVPPIGRGEEAALTHVVKHCTWVCVGGEDKLLPAAVVNDELQRRVQKIAEEEDRKVMLFQPGASLSKIVDALFLRQVWAGNEAMLVDQGIELAWPQLTPV